MNRTVNRIKIVFILITLISFCSLIYILYQNQKFSGNKLPSNIMQKLETKNNNIKKLIQKKYNIKIDIPIIISKKVPNNLFGLAVYNGGNIKIVLNKNRFKESSEYMINNVLPHEWAHAMMFVFGKFTKENGGHTKQWQDICLALDGIKCDRFVNHNDIVMGKLNFLD